MSSRHYPALALAVSVPAAVVSPAEASEATAPGGAGYLAVLDNDSMLRVHFAFRTPVVIAPDGTFKPAMIPGRKPVRIPEFQSPLPPADWRKVEFDDSAWRRLRAPLEMLPASATGRSPRALHSVTQNSLICARGKFLVEDPARSDVRDHTGRIKISFQCLAATFGMPCCTTVRPAPHRRPRDRLFKRPSSPW